VSLEEAVTDKHYRSLSRGRKSAVKMANRWCVFVCAVLLSLLLTSTLSRAEDEESAEAGAGEHQEHEHHHHHEEEKTAEKKEDPEARIYKIDGLPKKKQQDREFFRFLLRFMKTCAEDKEWKDRQKYLNAESIKAGHLTNGLYDKLEPETKEKLNALKKSEIQFQADLVEKGYTHMQEKERNEWNVIHQDEADKENFSQKDVDLVLARYRVIAALKEMNKKNRNNLYSKMNNMPKKQEPKTEQEL